MTPLILAACLAAQFPTPQYATPQQAVYSIPMPQATTQLVTLGAGQVIPAGPLGQCLGRLGQKLQRCSWPRVQPIAAAPVGQPVTQAVYVQLVQQPAAPQACYVMQTPPVAPIPPYGSKQAPTPYAGPAPQPQPQQPQQPAARHDESVPPVPPR